MLLEAIDDLNWGAVAGSAAVSFVLGLAWFTPPVLGHYWARQVAHYSGASEMETLDEGARPDRLLKWIVGISINVIVLALVIEGVEADSAAEGMLVGGALSLGFGATLSSWPPIFAKMPWQWWLVNNGAFLLMQTTAGGILAAWR
jgi:hypothetical protein